MMRGRFQQFSDIFVPWLLPYKNRLHYNDVRAVVRNFCLCMRARVRVCVCAYVCVCVRAHVCLCMRARVSADYRGQLR